MTQLAGLALIAMVISLSVSALVAVKQHKTFCRLFLQVRQVGQRLLISAWQTAHLPSNCLKAMGRALLLALVSSAQWLHRSMGKCFLAECWRAADARVQKAPFNRLFSGFVSIQQSRQRPFGEMERTQATIKGRNSALQEGLWRSTAFPLPPLYTLLARFKTPYGTFAIARFFTCAEKELFPVANRLGVAAHAIFLPNVEVLGEKSEEAVRGSVHLLSTNCFAQQSRWRSLEWVIP